MKEEFSKNKPSAFGCVAVDDSGNVYHQQGLTKREYFAAAALTGILASASTYDAAWRAVKAADDLIFELSKQK